MVHSSFVIAANGHQMILDKRTINAQHPVMTQRGPITMNELAAKFMEIGDAHAAVRLECLRLATKHSEYLAPEEVVDAAARYEKFVNNGTGDNAK